jgi:mono/diheme cytochrome c family protein
VVAFKGKIMLPGSKRVALGILFAALAEAHAAPIQSASRGEMLYSTHCIACHNAQVHWRDKKLARDWTTLQAEVRHWQKFTNLGWSDEDVALVARYLNTLYYRYPEAEKPGEQAGSAY